MALLGKAALAMWWDIAPDVNVEFQNWHSHEHFRDGNGAISSSAGNRLVRRQTFVELLQHKSE